MAALYCYISIYVTLWLLMTAVGQQIKECNLNESQCKSYRLGSKSSKYQSDCYESKSLFHKTEAFACVDICNPETAQWHHTLRCGHNCKGEWN